MFGNNEASIIDAVLAASGKDLDTKAQDAIKGMEVGDVAARRSADVKAFAPKLFANLTANSSLNGATVPAE